MKINGNQKVAHPVDAKSGGLGQGPVEVRQSGRPGDAVEISGHAKAATGQAACRRGPGAACGDMGATLERVRAELQQRINSGFYDSEDVLGSIANSMLDLFGI